MSTHADFEYIHVYPRFPNQVILQWNLINAFQSGVYTFTVYRSSSPHDDFISRTPVPLINKYMFNDKLESDGNLPISLFATFYYQIVVTVPDGTEIASPVITTGHWANRDILLKVQEIQRKYKLLSERYIGIPTYLLKVKKYGENCPKCWDEVKHESRDSRCPTCYGMGKIGGYFSPVLITGHFEVSPQGQMLTPDRGIIEFEESNFRAIADPIIDPYDVLVEKDRNTRWTVFRQVQHTEHKRIPVSQIVPVRSMVRSHMIYEFPIPGQDSFEPETLNEYAVLETGKDPGDKEPVV